MAAVVPYLEVGPEEREESSDVLAGLNALLIGPRFQKQRRSEMTAKDIARENKRRQELRAEGRLLGPDEVVHVGPPGKKKAHKKEAVDADLSPLAPLQKPHTELSRLLWARKLMIEAMESRTFSVEQDKGSVFVRVSPPIPVDLVPWHKSGQPLERFSLFSTNSKMACPTFDLPAGHMSVGGACPGAAAAQSTVPLDKRQRGDRDFTALAKAGRIDSRRLKVLNPGEDSVNWVSKEERIYKPELNIAVCTRCYATGGKYSEVVVQFSEVARAAFVERMLRSAPDKFIDLMVYTIVNTLDFLEADDPSRRFGIKPIRVHSSGDFYSTKYADAWMTIARKVQALDPTIRFWAPTRTQVIPAWVKYWDETKVPTNFSIRPSAYHVGDPAPAPLHPNQPAREGNSKGTSVLFPDQSVAVEGKYYDHQCQVYALEKGNKRCSSAESPSKALGGDGKAGCRACWVRPDLAVNYVIH
jgi:hypothetical protein